MASGWPIPPDIYIDDSWAVYFPNLGSVDTVLLNICHAEPLLQIPQNPQTPAGLLLCN